MIDKQDLQNMVTHVIKRDRGIPDKRLLHPKREWGFAVLVTTALLLAGSVWAFTEYEYFTQVGRQDFSVDEKKFEYDRGDVLESNEIYSVYMDAYQQLIDEVPEALPAEIVPEVSNDVETLEEVVADGEGAVTEVPKAQVEVSETIPVE